MKFLLSVFAAVLMLPPACVAKEPVLEGNYDLIAITQVESGESRTTPVGGQLQLSNNDYDFTMISPTETFNVKGKFSVNDRKLMIESYFLAGEEIRLSKKDQFVFDSIFTKKGGLLYLELIAISEEEHPTGLKLLFKKFKKKYGL